MYSIFISTYQGLEESLKSELVQLGVDSKRIGLSKRGVSVSDCSMIEVYQFNYELRLAIRVLINLAHFKISDVKDLHWKSKSINWHQWFSPNKSFKVDSIVNRSNEFNNPKYVSQLTKDGIVDCFKNTTDQRPDVDTENPDIKVHVLVSQDNVTISLDSSGESLHKRGYKTGSFRAPLSEVLAAGIVQQLGYENGMNIYDPMCGSGTILCEAFLYATNTPAGKYRSAWAFEHWLNYSEDDFLELRETAANNQTKFEGKIFYGDQYPSNQEMTEENLENIGFFNLEKSSWDFFEVSQPAENGLLIMNPPYDKRLELEEAQDFYKLIGDTFKKKFSGWKAGVFSANIPALKALGLKPLRRIPLWNGPLEGRLFLYDLY